ncbi:hypothetical protein [Rhizomonospora bruguierae]|uniref:hypothetical protein n=1 Tax=Rhizomonospora bruguierae TaxID=1581705 RepID=UPI001BCC62CF|nr:hypothetical protein [Micromonospora sp. NBRC 107566]
MGALVTLDLAAESPLGTMPWIITFGPLSDEEEWEPVVCGPYERPHALALAGSVVADEDLMAVVEPLLPHTTVDDIRGEIAAAQQAEAEAAAEEDEIGDDVSDAAGPDDLEDDEEEFGDAAAARMAPTEPPDPEEIRAGFARISNRLLSQH